MRLYKLVELQNGHSRILLFRSRMLYDLVTLSVAERCRVLLRRWRANKAPLFCRWASRLTTRRRSPVTAPPPWRCIGRVTRSISRSCATSARAARLITTSTLCCGIRSALIALRHHQGAPPPNRLSRRQQHRPPTRRRLASRCRSLIPMRLFRPYFRLFRPCSRRCRRCSAVFPLCQVSLPVVPSEVAWRRSSDAARDKPHVCPEALCGLRFYHRGDVYRHQRLKHGALHRRLMGSHTTADDADDA